VIQIPIRDLKPVGFPVGSVALKAGLADSDDDSDDSEDDDSMDTSDIEGVSMDQQIKEEMRLHRQRLEEEARETQRRSEEEARLAALRDAQRRKEEAEALERSSYSGLQDSMDSSESLNQSTSSVPSSPATVRGTLLLTALC